MPGFEWIGKEERKAVSSIFDQGGVLFAHGFENLRGGVYHVREFEAACSEYFGIRHCIAVSSGTAAVKVALKAAGVQRGDEVITQAFNFIAVVEAILDVGAIPIIANVERTLNMKPADAESLISPRTRALLPVHMLGVSADMPAFREMAQRHSLALIEDSCEAIGGQHQGRYLGGWGDSAAFSFDQGKMIATGEGGMVLTGDDQIAKYAREYHDHGHENNPSLPRGRDTKTIHGFNYRMTEMQAAVGKVQLGKLDKMLEANKERHGRLSDILGETYELREQLEGSESTDDAFVFFVEDEGVRGKVVALLQDTGFGTKNLPSAVEWHCAAYWDHALSQKQLDRAEETKRLLETAVAIPIWLKRSAAEYEVLAKKLLEIG